VRTDVRHEEEVKTLVDKTIARFGRLDIAVNTLATSASWCSCRCNPRELSSHLRTRMCLVCFYA